MPSERNRSKEDTWTTDELNRALKRDDGKRHREKDEQRRKDRHRDEMNGDSRRRKDDDERRHHRDRDDEKRSHRDEGRRRHRDDDGEDMRLTEEERERQRRERREKREGKGKGDEEKKKREHDSKRHKLVIEDDDDDGDRRKVDDERKRDEEREKRRQQREADEKKRRPKGDDEKRRHRDDEDREKRRSNRDEDDKERRKRDHDDDREKRRRRGDDDGDGDDRERRRRKDEEREQRHAEKNREREEERERRRREKEEEREQRHHRKDDDDDRKRHRDRDDDDDRRRRKDRDEEGRDQRKDRRHKEDERERQRRERRDKRDGGKSEKDKKRKEEEEQRRQRDKEREERKAREREEEEERKAKYRSHERAKSSRGGRKQQQEEEDYNYDDDDFEDYEEDFEDDDDDNNDDGHQMSVGNLQKSPRQKGAPLEYADNEIGDLLKALDKENERLLEDSRATSGRNKNRIQVDDDDYDDRRNRYDESDEEREQPKVTRSRTLINFIGAKKRVMTNKANSIMGKRAQDLLQMVSLDTSEFDLFDMPPVKEYDLYIRSFGRSDTTQAYVQTGDDDIEREVQTDEIDYRQKWTQHPPEDYVGCGRGDGEKDIEEEEESVMKKQPDLSRFSSFVQKACQAISILLEEGQDKNRTDMNANKSQVGLSEGYTRLSMLSILKGRHVQFAQFSPTQPNMLITAYSKSTEEDEGSPANRRGVVCVWNANEPSYPYRILICESQPTCCCFSPYQTSLAFAGMEDGSICVWDLRELSSMHRSVSHQDKDFVLRSPTYDTASVLESENHHSPVTTLNPVAAYSMSDPKNTDTKEESGAGLSFQLVSCEEQGCLNFWVVAEINNPDMAGSETDLGMSPGGRIKLVHSSVINLKHPTRYKKSGDSFKAFEMQLSPTDPNHLYIGTDSGYVLHCMRFGNRAFPSSHSAMSDAPIDVNSLDFSPFGHPCFLVTSNDGTVHLYSTKQEHPLVSWPPKIWDSRNLLCVRWSRSRPCVFYVVDDSSRLYTFDVLEGDAMPVRIDTLSQDRVTNVAFSCDNKNRLPQMLVSLESGETEIHTITKDYREQQTLENDFLPTYLSRF